MDPDVVGAVQLLPFVLLPDDRDLAVLGDGPQLVLLVRAGDELAVAVEVHPVAASSRLKEGRELAVRAPLQDPVVGLVGEEDVPGAVAGRTPGEGEIARPVIGPCPGGAQWPQ